MNLFRQPNTPTPATFSEGLRRANAALPEEVRIAFRPRRRAGVQPRPYRVLHQGQDVGGASTLPAAIFTALQEHRRRHG